MSNHSHSLRFFKISIAILSIVGYGAFVFAVGPFAPGTELDPACSPYINNDPLQGVDTDCTVNTIAADNGLTATGVNVGLGGILNQDTTIDLDGFDFSLTNGAFESTRVTSDGTATLINGNLPLGDYVGSMYVSNANPNIANVNGINLEFAAPVLLSVDLSNGDRASVTTSYRNGAGLNVGLGTQKGSSSVGYNLASYVDQENISMSAFDSALNHALRGMGISNNSVYSTLTYNVIDNQNYDYNSFAIDDSSLRFVFGDSNVGGVNTGSTKFYELNETRHRLSGNDIEINQYISTRDDSGTFTPVNFLYTDDDGNMLSAPTSLLGGGGSGPFSIVNGNSSIFSTGLTDTGLNSTATDAFYVGNNAGSGATGAYGSNFIGTAAGQSASGALNSNFLGGYAGSSATSASNSNFFGYSAGQNASGASSANFFGLGAGFGATSAANSNFFGFYTGQGATNASNSNFIGVQAGNNATNASYSTFIGANTGRYFAGIGRGTPNAANSIFIGREAAYTIADTGLNNTTDPDDFSILLGNYTSTGGFENSIALGQRAVNTASNQFMIGSSTRRIEEMVFNGGSGNTCSIVAGTGISCSSDERLKTNITDLDNTTLDKLLNIQTVTYNWKQGINQNTQIGFIAQNINEYFPELVSVNNDGMFAVNYAGMTPILTKAIQELDLKITNIESFASSIDTTFVDAIKDWLASATNSITLIVSDTLKARNQLCIDDVCITKDQLAEMMNNQGMTPPEIVADPVIENVDELEIVPEGESVLVSESQVNPQSESEPEAIAEPEPEVVSEPAPTVPVDGATE